MKNFLKKFVPAVAALAALVSFSAPREAHAAFFFDANYPDVKWKTFETEHFVFHYYETTSKKHPNTTAFTARRAAKYAEIMYPKVCEQFNHFLKEKVHIVVRDQEENANGFAVYTEDWVTIWATPLYYRFRGRMDWIPDVMTHEFSHIVSLKANDNRGVGMTLASDMGGLENDGRNNVAYGAAIPFGEGNSAPHWWTEGGAEFWTHNVGYNHWGTSRDMLLRMSMLDPDTTLSLGELSAPGSYHGFDGERGYNHGYSIGLYLAEKYGQETYSKFAKASQNKTRFEWESVIKEVLGITPQQMWEGWVQWNRDKYGRVKADLEKQGMHEGVETFWKEPLWIAQDPKKAADWKGFDKRRRRLTREKSGQTNYAFRVSPDGSMYGVTKGYSTQLQLTFLSPDTLPAFTGHYLDPKDDGKAKDAAPAAPAEKPKTGMSARDGDWSSLPDKDKLDRIPTWTMRGLADDAGVTGWSFSPDGKKLVVAKPSVRKCWGDYNVTGYDFNDLVIVDLAPMMAQADLVRAGKKKEMDVSCSQERNASKQITTEARATQPDWSPDGQWIAFLKYGDGTYNLAKIKPDGTGLTMLTNFKEGEQMGEPRWSPDSKKLVFFFFKPVTNDQQDLWTINGDGTEMKPLTWDKAEDKDAFWTADGKSVLFSSDRSGIFNVYKLELASGKVEQVTNVLGGAFAPALTHDGNLLYTGFNAYGFQNYGLKKSDFYGKATDVEYKVSEKQYSEVLAKEEELPPLPKARKYSSIKDLEPPVFIPIMRYEGRNVQGGGEVLWWDYTGKHALISDLLLGQNQDYVFRYLNNMWYPEMSFVWARFARSSELGYEVSPGKIGELKLRSQVDFYLASMNWKLGGNTELTTGVNMRSFDLGFGTAGGNLRTDTPLSFGKHGISSTAEVSAQLHHFQIDPGSGRGTFNINPRGSKEYYLNVAHDTTTLPGGNFDDGERLTSYNFNKLDVNFVDYIALPWLEYQEHTLQFTAQAGYVDRNVQYNDEYFAGGQHPYSRFNQINVNTEFAGYPAFSVTGETQMLASAAYRFPLYRDVNKKMGPLYVDNVFFQFFGTAGNLWSFRPRPDANGVLNANAANGNVRELPLIGLFNKKSSSQLEGDYAGIPIGGLGGTYGKSNPSLFDKAFPVAYKNGNRLLTDVGAEVRVRAWIYNYNPWFSFFRLAYGLQSITGVGDVNGDHIVRQLPPADDPVGEVQKSGFRYYIGLGTGW